MYKKLIEIKNKNYVKIYKIGVFCWWSCFSSAVVQIGVGLWYWRDSNMDMDMRQNMDMEMGMGMEMEMGVVLVEDNCFLLMVVEVYMLTMLEVVSIYYNRTIELCL